MTAPTWSRARGLVRWWWWALIGVVAFTAGDLDASVLQRPDAAPRLVPLTARSWAWVATDDRSSNGALFVGDEAALIVDPGLTPALAEAFLTAAREVSGKPVRYVVVTHWHPDHAAGVMCMADWSFEVIAHPKTRRHLAERGARQVRDLARGATSQAEAADFARCTVSLPDGIVENRRVIDLGSHRLEVFHPGEAHTPGDLVVWSPEERVLATGDVFMHDASPSMDEGSAVVWVDVLNQLIDLKPTAVVAGHFGPSKLPDLKRFRDYMTAQVQRVAEALEDGAAPDAVPSRLRFPEFADFRQYPQYGATFAGNAAAVVREFLGHAARRGETAGFRVVTKVEVGRNPHQISFSADGKMAFVAAAGSDRVTLVDAISYRVVRSIPIEGTPLGVVPLPGGGGVAVTRFGAAEIVRYDLQSGELGPALRTGRGPSLFAGPLPGDRYLLSVEQTNQLWVFDAARYSLERAYPTAKRPFPAAPTSDGRLAFVPGYDDGAVTVVDLWNQRVLGAVPVGTTPSGGVVLPGDIDYAVAVRGEDEIVFVNTASHEVVGALREGIGDSPFSVVLAPDGRVAFVNNTASHDVSVIGLPERRVVARIPVGEIPIVMAVHPTGRTLWVSSEGSHEVSVIDIPDRWRATSDTGKPLPSDGATSVTQVAVMGMIHGRHRTSTRWGLEQVKDAIRRYNPDAVCAEIAPDRWERIWSDFTERGVIEDPRVLRFPEYVDAILSLSVELGLEIIPCAGWTQEMSDLREARIAQFEREDRYAGPRAEYARRLAAVRAQYDQAIADNDDPRYIHSTEYDERTREELALYDEYQNDLIGPGGWTNINEAHYRLIDRAVRARRGERILITFGAGHKYWFLDRLRERDDVELLDLDPYLP